MKKLIRIVGVVLVVLSIGLGCFLVYNNIRKDKLEKERKIHIEEVKKHFSTYGLTNKETNLYKFENGKFEVYGKVNKNIKLVLSEIKDDYYSIKDLDLYVYYNDIDKIDEFTYNDRYKRYIVFNTNIKTKNITNFYDQDNNLVYSINNSYDFKVIIKDTDRYGIEFNNELLYINKSDVEKAYSNNNTSEKNKKNIRVITYHHIYSPKSESCNQTICLTLNKLEEQFKYLSDNNYLTLTLPELELYMDGKLQIPNKSTVLTFDDGTFVNYQAIELFGKYKINATMFLVTSWVSKDAHVSEYLALESHTHNMHNQYECPGYGMQGGGILCLSEEKIKNDLKTSQEKLGGSTYFAYPFFDWNERAIRLLKETGFRMAFVGAAGNDGISTPGVTDKFQIKRKTMFSDVTLNSFINEYLN